MNNNNNSNNNHNRRPYNNYRKMAVYRVTVRYNPLELLLEFKDYPAMTLKGKDAEKWIEDMKKDYPAFDWNMT